MAFRLTTLLLGWLFMPFAQQASADTPWMTVTYKNTNGTTETLASAFPNQAIVVVNTASKCGFTVQYAGLQDLHEKFSAKGLAVVAFPSNDFGGQEPGTDTEIATFCQANYGVTFPVKSKIPTKGEGKHPLYAALTEKSPFTGEVAWNFEKFIINRQGVVVARFKSGVKPDDAKFIAAVEEALK
jgi:glutathione peroxidase